MAIKHSKVNSRANTSDTTAVQPSDWNDVHIIDAASIGSDALAPSGITPGTYIIARLVVNAAGLITQVN